MNEEDKKFERTILFNEASRPPYSLPCAAQLVDYIVYGNSTGGFLYQVLCNNLCESAITADHVNATALSSYGSFLIHHAPADCFGSEKEVSEWKGIE